MLKANWSNAHRNPEPQVSSMDLVHVLRGDPKIEAYVPEELYARFNQKCSESGLDPSDMLTDILKGHLQLTSQLL
jgi:hypothetical protein